YDGAGDAATPPVKGDQTGQWNWLNPGNRWITTSASYDAYGNKVSSTDGLGNRAETIYDPTYHLFPVEERNALYVQNGDTRQKTTASFDAQCQQPSSSIDLNGQTTSYGYDGLCRITSVTQPLGAFKTFSYHDIGNATYQYIETHTPGAAGQGDIWTQDLFDGYGRLIKTIRRAADPTQGAITEDTNYDARGNKASITPVPYYYPSQTYKVAITSFDSRDRPIKVTNPDGSFKTMSYEVADPASVAGAFLQVTTTDELNRKTVAVTDAYGRTVRQTATKQGRALHRTLGYDALGRLTSLSDPAGNSWTNVFDTLGRRTSVKDPDLGTWSYAYDDGGNLTTLTDAKGQKTGYNYDRLNRVTGQVMRSDLPNGDPQRDNIGFLYDEARSGAFNVGKQTTAANKHAWLTANYDALGNEVVKTLLTTEGTTYTTTTAYDAGKRILWRTFGDGTSLGSAATPFGYNGAGQLTSIPGLVSNVTYNAAGQSLATTYANGVTSTSAYDATRGWLNSLTAAKGGTNLLSLNYTRAATGRIDGITSPGGASSDAWSYGYDELDQLTSASNAGNASFNETYSYDDAGNLTSKTDVGTYTYPAQGPNAVRPHAVGVAGTTFFTYDDNGNMLTGHGRTYSWDGMNRPTQIVSAYMGESPGATSSYFYGPDGSRVKKVTKASPRGCTTAPNPLPTETTTYVFGDERVSYEGSSDPCVPTTPLWVKYPMPDIKIEGTGATAKSYTLLKDHLGSVRVVADQAGTTSIATRYQPFGLAKPITTSTATKEDHGYIGERQDETGLLYLNARYYDPHIARFVSPDWWDPTQEGVGTNRYAYA
ncbi:RHS repeat-associated core domain-containing protein, partial [Labrys sp. 22185]|uniref:RHS repeat-associated core domain-containing protein n=1 Tax=Labrys sp. 22185 TaxID=3453888 RepID=UPI003F86202E